MKFLSGQSQIPLRKNKLGNRTLTAGELKMPEGLQSLINHDDSFRFLRTLRGSSSYFERAKERPVSYDPATRTCIAIFFISGNQV